jgi:ABC-type sugar transport system ATPase subunit
MTAFAPSHVGPRTREPLLEMRGIRKSFDGVQVLHGVDLTLRAGEIHALVGENGAGKSTLIKILGGVHRDFSGLVRIDGVEARPRGVRDAERLGVAIIHQELALIPHMTVAENVFLGREPRSRLGTLDRAGMNRAAQALLRERLGLELDPDRRIESLPIALRQMVEIGRALSRDARIVVMDEPSSALSEPDVERLFAATRQLRERGVGVIYISHRLEEIYALADRITVLRDGRTVAEAPASAMDRDEMIRHMVGRTIEQFFPRHQARPGDELLRTEGLSVRQPGSDRPAVHRAALNCRRGEIVGIAGLLGSGATTLLEAIFGLHPGRTSGRTVLEGRPVNVRSPRAAIARGVAFLTNDRQAGGLIPPMSVLANLTLASLNACRVAGVISSRREQRIASQQADRINTRAPSLRSPVATLSGGNQQKVVLGKWLLTAPRLLLLDEPTRGVDVGAKAEIYALINRLVEEGMGILLVSSDLPELLALSDRVYVMHRGRMMAELPREQADQERVMRSALGDAADAGC